MTIAAGFNASDGVLLCADTLHTTQAISKLHATKLFRKEYPNGARSAIAVIGNIAYARMLMQHVERSIGEMEAHHLTVGDLRDAIELEVAQLHTDNLFKHPSFQYGTVSAQIICAAWSPVDKKVSLYWTQDSAVNELHGYTCLGAGEYLAHFLIRPQYDRGKSIADLKPIATDALEKVKDYVDGCGGFTDTIMLMRDGTLGAVERITPSGVQRLAGQR